MKAILMSIRPEWVCKILNNEKTIEVRKKFPKDYVGWVYLYCTKDYKNVLFENGGYGWKLNTWTRDKKSQTVYNGKVVARFWCDKVETINEYYYYPTKTLSTKELEEKSCLNMDNIIKYLNNKIGYAIYISKVEVFEKPKELWQFSTKVKLFKEPIAWGTKTAVGTCQVLHKAPQNFCYIEVRE